MEVKEDQATATQEDLGTVPAEKNKRSRKRNIITFIVVTLLNGGLLLLLLSQLMTPAPAPSGAKFGSAEALGDVNSPLLGKPAPDFTLPELVDKSNPAQIRLADLKGKPVILNFWASWCDPCKEEAPFLAKIEPELKAKGIVFIGINSQDGKANALKFLQSYGVNYLNVQDSPDGQTAISYGTYGFPETFFIDQDGVVVAKYTGELNEQGLRFELKKLGIS